ncbi:sulfite exporter TauE/SafE family protein [Rhizobium sp. NXC24]|uniref:sulfite exporter TauE/SafE family protein n=1 Tax=Rhizobium sp. NXC24 TaxID=2048897 RepID=UPI000CDF4527|nr:sulfite exporter TauE/SafE family protein [Rhizobium sp. NXC24]AVA23876.1 TauE/SafE family permease protein [Rhizobium sp. NXC24]
MTELSLISFVGLGFGLLAAGAITGLLAGLFGVGGGAVAVPILYELFSLLNVPEEVRMPMAVGTSLAIIIPTSVLSFIAHRAKGAVDISILKLWAGPVVIGVVMGSIAARFAPGDLFKIVYVAVAAVSAVRLLFGRDSWRLGLDMPGRGVMLSYGWLIGVLSALMGVGGGQLSNLFMTFYNRPIHQAIATSSGLGVLISVPGAIGYIYAGWPRMADYPELAVLQPPLALGYVSLLGLALFIPTSTWMAPRGARLAHTLSKRRLEVTFGLFLLIVCGRFIASLLA